MKKYRLKKDLPLAKVGDLVYVMKNKSKNSETYKIYEYIEEYQDNRTGKVLWSIDFKDFWEWFEEIEQEKDIWNLDIWDFYYCIIQCKVEKITILDDFIYILYYEDLQFWNVFKSKEEGEKELERRKAIQSIKRYCWENNINMNDSVESQTFYYNSITWNIEYTSNFKNWNPIWYFSFKDAPKILEKFKEKLKIILDF